MRPLPWQQPSIDAQISELKDEIANLRDAVGSFESEGEAEPRRLVTATFPGYVDVSGDFTHTQTSRPKSGCSAHRGQEATSDVHVAEAGLLLPSPAELNSHSEVSGTDVVLSSFDTKLMDMSQEGPMQAAILTPDLGADLSATGEYGAATCVVPNPRASLAAEADDDESQVAQTPVDALYHSFVNNVKELREKFEQLAYQHNEARETKS